MERLPLFSPTQVISNENVLHSIFSPSYRGTSMNNRAPLSDATNHKNPVGSNSNTFIKYSANNTKQSRSKVISSPASQSSRTQLSVRFQQPTSPGVDSFFTPNTFHSSSSPVSTISALSYSTSCTSFRTIPIDMLSFEYVRECKVQGELEQIVDTLQADGPRNYPSLLKAAKQRLKIVQEGSENLVNILHENDSQLSFSMTHISSTSSEPYAMYEPAKESIHRMNSISEADNGEKSLTPSLHRNLVWSETSTETSSSPLNESSLVMSVSTTCFEEMDFETRSSTLQSQLKILGKPLVPPIPTQLNPVTPGSIRLPQLPPVSGRLQKQLQQMRDERNNIEKNLKDQVTKLTRNLENVEKARQMDQSILLGKLQEVESKKAQVEEEVAMLETAVRTTTERAKDIVSNMTVISQESKSLRKALDDERQNSKRSNKIEAALRVQINQMSRLIADGEFSAKQAKETAEMTIRNEFDDERVKHKLAAKALNRCLHDARSMLQSIKNERSHILKTLSMALGKDSSDVVQLNSAKRMELVAEVAAKLGSSKSAITAFAKALACSENDSRAMKATKALSESRIVDLISLKDRLERENLMLTKKNQVMAEELESGRAYIDKLVTEKGGRSGWSPRDEEYKNTISILKKQIRTGESMVSIALYQQAIGEARQSALQCKCKDQEILALRSNVGVLKESLEKCKADSILKSPKPVKISLNHESLSHGQFKFTQFHNPKKPLAPMPSLPQPVPIGNQAVRISAVKAAGGRAGLCAKLKKMRRPPIEDCKKEQ